MLRKIFIVLVLIVLVFNTQEKTPKLASSDNPIPTQEMSVETKQLDPRAVILRDYLAKYNSPLQDYSQDFIDASDKYGVDWKLVPAISGVESTFGQFTPGGYNDWGWGVYGNQAIYFKSQKEGIYTITQNLKDNYISKGLTTPYQINYSYAASPYWGSHVAYFMEDLDRFASKYNLSADTPLKSSNLETQTVSSSAKIALN